MPVQQFDRWVRRHVRRIRLGQFLHRCADLGAIFLCLLGAVVLISKLAIPVLWPQVLWLAAGLIPVNLIVWWLVLRQPWDRAESVARLDRSLGANGLLMTLSERPDSEWERHLPQLDKLWRDAIPRIRPKRFAMNMALPLVFAIATCFVPLRDATRRLFAHNTPAGNAARKLEELLEEVNEAATLEPEERTQIKQELAKLSDEARDKPFDSRKWETLDALRERLHERIDSASTLTLQAQDAISGLQKQELAQESSSKLSPQEVGSENQLIAEKKAAPKQSLNAQQEKEKKAPATREAREKLAQSLRKSASERAAAQQRQQALQKNLSQALQQLAKQGALDKASPELRDKLEKMTKRGGSLELPAEGKERQKMLSELRDLLAQENIKLARLQQKSSPPLGSAGTEENGSQGGQDGHADQKQQESHPGQAGENEKAHGRGGVGRGSGETKMTWGDETAQRLQKFKEMELPKGAGTDPKKDLMNITKTAPSEKSTASASHSEQRKMEATAGSVSVHHKLSPRHRGAVRRFFEEPKAGAKAPE